MSCQARKPGELVNGPIGGRRPARGNRIPRFLRRAMLYPSLLLSTPRWRVTIRIVSFSTLKGQKMYCHYVGRDVKVEWAWLQRGSGVNYTDVRQSRGFK